MGTTTFSGPVVSLNGFEGDIVSAAVDTGAVNAADGTGALTIANTTGLTTFVANVAIANGKNVAVGTTTGTKFGTSASQKIGFFNATPVAQQNTTGTTAGFTAGAGTAVLSDSTFTGNTGTKAYTIGDIVRALKNLGLLAAS